MPELPEVETISHILSQGGEGFPPLPGQVVEQAVVLWERTIAMPDAARLRNPSADRRSNSSAGGVNSL